MTDNDDRVITRIENDLKELEDRLEKYVLLALFEAYKEAVNQRIKPLEKLVYGLVGLVLISFVTALVSLVIIR